MFSKVCKKATEVIRIKKNSILIFTVYFKVKIISRGFVFELNHNNAEKIIFIKCLVIFPPINY